MATSIPDWFTKAIADGLARMYALNLDGCPAADVLAGTQRVWAEDLWERLKHGEPTVTEDLPRIREAFRRLRTSCMRWPAPAQFLRELPPRRVKRPDMPALPPGKLPDAERARRIIEGNLRREACGFRRVAAPPQRTGGQA